MAEVSVYLLRLTARLVQAPRTLHCPRRYYRLEPVGIREAMLIVVNELEVMLGWSPLHPSPPLFRQRAGTQCVPKYIDSKEKGVARQPLL